MLKIIRKKLKMTQEQMAKELELDVRTIGANERKLAAPRLYLMAYRMVAVERAMQ